MPPPEKLKRKLLTPDADGDGRTDRQTDIGNTICLFHHSSNGGGIQKFKICYCFIFIAEENPSKTKK